MLDNNLLEYISTIWEHYNKMFHIDGKVMRRCTRLLQLQPHAKTLQAISMHLSTYEHNLLDIDLDRKVGSYLQHWVQTIKADAQKRHTPETGG